MQAMTLFKEGTGLLSIRWKMTLLYTALLALLLGAFGTFIYFSAQRLMEDNLQQSLQNHFSQALMQAHHSADEINNGRDIYNPFSPDDTMQFSPGNDLNQPGSSPLSRRLAPTIERLSGPGLFVQISDTSGKVLATSSNLGDSHLPLPTILPATTNQTRIERVQFPAGIKLTEDLSPQDLNKSLLMMQSGLVVDDHGKVFGLLQVAQSLVSVEQVRDGLVDVLTEGLAVALVLAIVAGLWLAGRLLRPIDKITETAQRIEASGDLSRRIPVARVRSRKFTFDEVSRLTATFNAMLARLEKSFLAQRQFIADASHELKTPLTAILGHANLLRRHGKTDPALVDEATTAIIEEAQRLHRMTLDLLELARADEAAEKTSSSNRLTSNFEVFSLTGLANQVIKEMQPIAHDQGINLKNQAESEHEKPVLIKGDPARFKQVVVNLVDNALKFTPSGGQVTLAVKLCPSPKDPSSVIPQPPQAVLEVNDTGCGIPAEALPHIFERFYRADQARSHSTLGVSSGSGLGLAIVQEVVQQHNGTLKVESQPGAGSCFEVILPAAKTNNSRNSSDQ
jgi:signal transduction histidine kinase